MVRGMDEKQTSVASLEDIHEYAAGIPMKWVGCRESTHKMEPTWVKYANEEASAILRTSLCARCGTKKHQTISADDGSILHVEYEYPEGYTLPKGTGRVDAEGRGVFRLQATMALMERITDKSEKAASVKTSTVKSRKKSA